MARLLDAARPGFAAEYERLIAGRGGRWDEAEAAARRVVDDVRARGVAAILEAAAKHDQVAQRAEDLRVGGEALKRARDACAPELIAALESAAARIHDFHSRQVPEAKTWTDASGVTLGWRWTAVDAAGLYAPGGLAAYPSSVLMNAIPAKAAGVKRLVMATPPGRLESNPSILAAADIAGVDEVWAIGGAQAIAAMAYGAEGLTPCDVVVGPGNAYVAAAKKIVFGDVGIDAIAGPSEVFILCDGACDPAWIAADLLAQAEHDADAQSVLFTTSATFANAVTTAVDVQLEQGLAGQSARESWNTHGAVIIVRALDEACTLVDRAAPEHVQIVAANAGELAAIIRHAGAIFLGVHAPEALGDYMAGPSHVLPTARAARYASGVNVLTFMKRTTLIGATPDAMQNLAPAGAVIADAEGLPAHAHSLRIRRKP